VNHSTAMYQTALAHLARASGIMDGLAEAADQSGGVLDSHRISGMLQQAAIHAQIGAGYAQLASAPPPEG